MTFCHKLKTVVNHTILQKFFTPISCSRKFFHFSHVSQFDKYSPTETDLSSAWNSSAPAGSISSSVLSFYYHNELQTTYFKQKSSKDNFDNSKKNNIVQGPKNISTHFINLISQSKISKQQYKYQKLGSAKFKL